MFLFFPIWRSHQYLVYCFLSLLLIVANILRTVLSILCLVVCLYLAHSSFSSLIKFCFRIFYNTFLLYFNFQVNIYFAVFFQFVFVSYVRIYPWTFFSELWLIVTLIFYQVFALSCLTIALVSYAIFQANFTLTNWISFLFSSLFVAEIK